MKIICTLNFKYSDSIEAENIVRSVQVDNYSFVNTEIDENEIISKIEGKSLASLIHTLDDYLSCVSVAERVVLKIPVDSKSH
jgi:hypothetical protein